MANYMPERVSASLQLLVAIIMCIGTGVMWLRGSDIVAIKSEIESVRAMLATNREILNQVVQDNRDIHEKLQKFRDEQVRNTTRIEELTKRVAPR